MSLNISDSHGVPIDRQRFTWRDMVQTPISKLDDDAYTRVRIILMKGIEIAYEQVAIDVTAGVALREPDPCLAQVCGHPTLVDRFRHASTQEAQHLVHLRGLVARLTLEEATLHGTPVADAGGSVAGRVRLQAGPP
jgi:hypothetical protein